MLRRFKSVPRLFKKAIDFRNKNHCIDQNFDPGLNHQNFLNHHYKCDFAPRITSHCLFHTHQQHAHHLRKHRGCYLPNEVHGHPLCCRPIGQTPRRHGRVIPAHRRAPFRPRSRIGFNRQKHRRYGGSCEGASRECRGTPAYLTAPHQQYDLRVFNKDLICRDADVDVAGAQGTVDTLVDAGFTPRQAYGPNANDCRSLVTISRQSPRQSRPQQNNVDFYTARPVLPW